MFLSKMAKVKNSLALRLTAWYTVILFLFSLAIFTVFYFGIYAAIMQAMDAELTEEVEELRELLTKRGIDKVKAEIREEDREEDPTQSFIRLMANDGNIIVSTDMSSWGRAAIPPTELKKVQHQPHILLFETITIPGTGYKARVLTASAGSKFILQFGRSIERMQRYLEKFRHQFMLLSFVCLIISGLIGWIMAKAALKGLEKVTQTAELISKGNFNQRVTVKRQYHEITRLADTFNVMLDRIQELVQGMREITDNIAHDLRSPLTRIRGIAEMSLISTKEKLTPQQAAASTIEECDNLIEIINTMLDITEIESGVAPVENQPININDLLSNIRELFLPLTEKNKIQFDLDIENAIQISGDRRKIQRLMYNLIDNAVKYTPFGGSICLSARLSGDRLLIEVSDSGHGISAADLPRIFDRFYRADRSRSQTGTGLGLSLSQAIVHAMGGSIEVTSELNHGSRFSILIPLSPPPSC